MDQMLSLGALPTNVADEGSSDEEQGQEQRGCMPLAFHPVRWKSDITAQSSHNIVVSD